MNQYPAAFEFTETYLTVLSDSMWIPLFSTFLFSGPRQHAQVLKVSMTYFIWSFDYLYLYMEMQQTTMFLFYFLNLH